MYAHTAAGEGIGPIADATRAGPGLGASPTGPGAPPAPDTTSPMRIDLSMSMNLPYGPYSTAPSLAGPPQLTAQLPMAPPQLPYPNPHHHQPPPLPRGLAYPAVYPPSHSASGAGVESSEALSLPKVAASECPSAFLPPPALHHMPRPGPLPLGHHPAFLPHHYDPGHHGPAVELPVERGPVDHYHHLHFLDQADRGASYVSSLAGPCVGQGEAELRFRGHPLSSAQLHSSGLHAPSLHGPPLQTPTLEPSAPPPPHRMLIDQSLHHQLSLQPPMPPVEPSKPKARGRKSSAVRKHQCPECLKQYCRRSTLKAHLRFHKGERPFRCPDCAKTFSQAANLTAHRRVHTGEKPFSCPVCRRPFSQSSSLVTHKRTHTGERPYQCRDCGKAFTDSSTLTKHLRTHSGAKPYECQLCSLTFSQSGNLNRHMKTHFNPPPPIDHDSLLPPHLS